MQPADPAATKRKGRGLPAYCTTSHACNSQRELWLFEASESPLLLTSSQCGMAAISAASTRRRASSTAATTRSLQQLDVSNVTDLYSQSQALLSVLAFHLAYYCGSSSQRGLLPWQLPAVLM
jgi:hypothetical protein